MEWRIDEQLVSYPDAEQIQQDRVKAILTGQAEELVWLLEHPPLYTAGPRSKPEDLLDPDRFPVFKTRRGGEFTYHGPGQRIAYVMLDLSKRRKDARAFVWALEEWIIRVLSEFNVKGERRSDRVGVWVRRVDRGEPEREDKIAALGVRLHKWVSFHGIAINLEPDLEHFSGITPCGIRDHGVTSLVDLGLPVTFPDLDLALQAHFSALFDSPEEWQSRK